MSKTQVSVALDDDVLAELDRLADQQKRSRGNLIAFIVGQALQLGKAVSG